MSKQRDRILNVLPSPSNFKSRAEGIGKGIEDIEALDAGNP
jgi:hypothetical protein